jgi:hypothetical protein
MTERISDGLHGRRNLQSLEYRRLADVDLVENEAMLPQVWI